MRALVIDDSRAVRKILRQYLEDLNFEVLDAEDGRDALEKFEQVRGRIDLALVDWNMPRMGGLDFVKAVRALPYGQTVQMMMVTTETEIERIATALEAGANEYVMKPFTKEMIEEKIRLLTASPV